MDNRATKQKVLDVVDVSAKSVAFLFARVDVVKLDVVVEAFLSERDGVVDLDRFRELSVGLQVASLVGRVLQDDVGLAVLVVSETNLKKKPNKCFLKFCRDDRISYSNIPQASLISPRLCLGSLILFKYRYN